MTPVTRILVIDDEPIVGERLKASLELAGFMVDAFVSSQDALNNLKLKSYDILVTDLKMKPPDGLEVLRAAKQHQPDIKAVVITGFATKQLAADALSAGAVHFLAKPFKMSHLTKLLRTISSTRE
ncbi:MAG: response regulator [Acidobacteriota bacterium]|jgi:DNA-binding NtrC family response regulator